MPPVKIIPCTEDHGPAILAILNEAIVHSTSLYEYVPRPSSSMKLWFETKQKGNYPVLGAQASDGTLMGFATYGPFRLFPGYKYSIEHSVYVEKSFRGQGVAKSLMQELIATAQRQDYHLMVGVIDSANEASIHLHRSFNFTHGGTLHHAGFKFTRWLDIHFYQLLLPTPQHPVEG